MLAEQNAATVRKDSNADALNSIEHGLAAIRNAAPSDFVDRWAAAAWQLALNMGGN